MDTTKQVMVGIAEYYWVKHLVQSVEEFRRDKNNNMIYVAKFTDNESYYKAIRILSKNTKKQGGR